MDSHQNTLSDISHPKLDGPMGNASALADSAKAKLGEIAEPVREKAMEVAEQQKDAGADQIRTAARAVHGAARELESEMPQFAGYIHEAGQRLEKVASELREGSLDDLMSSLGEFARNQPAVVFGGAMLAGFALTRFVKSSAQHPSASVPAPAGMTSAPAQMGVTSVQGGMA